MCLLPWNMKIRFLIQDHQSVLRAKWSAIISISQFNTLQLFAHGNTHWQACTEKEAGITILPKERKLCNELPQTWFLATRTPSPIINVVLPREKESKECHRDGSCDLQQCHCSLVLVRVKEFCALSWSTAGVGSAFSRLPTAGGGSSVAAAAILTR